MRIIFLLLVVMTFLAGELRAQGSSSGRVVTAVATVFGGQGLKADDRSTVTVAFLMPERLDDAGTITLLFRGPQYAGLLAINRNDLPEELRFIAGEQDSLYLLPHDTSRSINPFKGTQNQKISLKYDRRSEAASSHKVQLLDALARPMTDVAVSMEIYGLKTNGGSSPRLPLPVDGDGHFVLPSWYNSEVQLPNTMRTNQFWGSVFIRELFTNQEYVLSMPGSNGDKPSIIQVPFAAGAEHEGLDEYEVRILNADGSPADGVSMSLARVYGSDKATTVVVPTVVRPDAYGRVRLMTALEMGLQSSSKKLITGSVQQGGAYPNFSSVEFALSPGENPDIMLAKRLDVDAQLIAADGTPVEVSRQRQPYMNGPFIYAIKDRPGFNIPPSAPIHFTRPEDTIFSLNQLPVPGRYFIKAFDKQYGPIDVGITSPTQLLSFKEAVLDGNFVGAILDENKQPLEGALVVASSRNLRWQNFQDVAPLVEKLKSVSHDEGRKLLNEITSGTYDFAVTDKAGRYDFSRQEGSTYLNFIAAAPDRFVAKIDGLRDNGTPLSEDIKLPEARLPGFAYAVGIAHAPAEVSDADHLGAMKPLPTENATYGVGLWGSQQWFAPPRKNNAYLSRALEWSYNGPAEDFKIGDPFKARVPAGTTFTLRTYGDKLHLSMELWRTTQTLAAGQTMQLDPVTMRAVRPYYLKVLDRDGERVPNCYFSTLYSDMSRTDSRGVALCYHDDWMAPQTWLYPNNNNGPISVRMQKLDTATSVPVLTFNLPLSLKEMEPAQ